MSARSSQATTVHVHNQNAAADPLPQNEGGERKYMYSYAGTHAAGRRVYSPRSKTFDPMSGDDTG